MQANSRAVLEATESRSSWVCYILSLVSRSTTDVSNQWEVVFIVLVPTNFDCKRVETPEGWWQINLSEDPLVIAPDYSILVNV